MRRPYGRGFESQCSKVAATPATSASCLGARFQTLIWQERVFVYPQQGKISSYAAIMESFHMKKYLDNTFISPFPQRLDSCWRPASGLPTIENTYAQLL